MLRNNFGRSFGLKQSISNNSIQPIFSTLLQIRTATKKVSGSKTNKNDSAGRRLGPKAYENHFVKPGQIIVRQRGTRVHPGENVDIGKDHTIFALEPGYVKFYYNPFHPLRKYVGVSLKKELNLPTEHFSPRVRRFGYEIIHDSMKAQQEEDHMSREEYLQQEHLVKKRTEKEEFEKMTVQKYESEIQKFIKDLSGSNLQTCASRLVDIFQFMENDQTITEAQRQTTYSYIHKAKLAKKRGEMTEEQLIECVQDYKMLAERLDKRLMIDAQGVLHDIGEVEAKNNSKSEVLEQLESQYFNKLLSREEKRIVIDLLQSPGVFTKSEQERLHKRYLPKNVPSIVPGSAIENINPKSPPKGTVLKKIFDDEREWVRIIAKIEDESI